MVNFFISFPAVLVLVPAIILLIISPGKPEPFTDKNGNPLAASISEKIFVNINGVQQGMFIQSKDSANPVLLYLHGGIPDYFLTKKYPTGLGECFTVVWWEQRGFGLSYNAGVPHGSVTLGQMISDTREVTNYLRNRFGHDKIYLMGRSGGTYIGAHVAAQSPELYHAYIAVAQMSDQLKSERLAYDYMLKEYSDAGNREMVRKLEVYPVTDEIPYGYLKLRDKAMHGLGVGTTREMNSIVTGIFLPSLACRDYTLTEKVNLWRAKASAGVHPLWKTILANDLTTHVTEFQIPVYFFHGIYDYTVSYNLAKDYFEMIKAPVKGFYTFQQSAHSPIFEEPGKAITILKTDVLKGTNILADEK